MNRELLEKPFEPSQIKQREGNFGKTLDYIEGHVVIQRHNDALEAEWSYSVISHEVLKETEEVIVLGQQTELVTLIVTPSDGQTREISSTARQ